MQTIFPPRNERCPGCGILLSWRRHTTKCRRKSMVVHWLPWLCRNFGHHWVWASHEPHYPVRDGRFTDFEAIPSRLNYRYCTRCPAVDGLDAARDGLGHYAHA